MACCLQENELESFMCKMEVIVLSSPRYRQDYNRDFVWLHKS